MAIRLQTDPTGLIARQNFTANLFFLSDSVRKLSSGLRVNRTLDDPLAVTIASQFDSQARGLGQAARNANDGIAAMQVADNSLAVGIDLLNQVLAKVQAATGDDLATDDRAALQTDITKLLAELDQLVDSTTYHDVPLLTGTYSNKSFQVGPLSGEAVTASLASARPNRLGQVQTGEVTITAPRGGRVNLRLDNQANDETILISSVTLAFANDPDQGMGALAGAINAHAETTGISAWSVVASQSGAALTAGITPASFSINGVEIGAVVVQAGDSDGRLRNAINATTASHGVEAQVGEGGTLVLSAADGRGIAVTGSAGSLGFSDSEMTTFGYTRLLQEGPYHLTLADSSSGLAVAFSPTMRSAGPLVTTIDSTLTPDSLLGGSSTLAAGWTAGLDLSGADLSGDIVTTQASTLALGSVLAAGSVLASSSTLGGAVTLGSDLATGAETVLRTTTVLASGSVLKQGSYLTNAIVSTGGPLAAGQILASDATLAADLTLSRDMLLVSGSVLESGSALAAASRVGGTVTLGASLTVGEEMTLATGSTIKASVGGAYLTAGSTIGGPAQLAGADLTVTETMLVKAGSTLSATSEPAMGSTLGGAAVLAGDHAVSYDLFLAGGSIIASGSLVKAGTTLTNGLTTTSGLISVGTTTQDYTTSGANPLTLAMTLRQGSLLVSGSTLAAQSRSETALLLSQESSRRLIDLSVLSKDAALTAVKLTEAAIADLERIRQEAAGISDQLTGLAGVRGEGRGVMENARSQLLAVDFGAEAENYTKMEMLIRTSSFALTQANAKPANVFMILQGGGEDKANQFFIEALNRMLTGAVVG